VAEEVRAGINYGRLRRALAEKLREELRRQPNYISDHNWFLPTDLNAHFAVVSGTSIYDANAVLLPGGRVPSPLPLKTPMPSTTDVYNWGIVSTRAFSYPMAFFYAKLPDWTGIANMTAHLHFGFELMRGECSGLIDFLYESTGTTRGKLTAYVCGAPSQIDLTPLLPDQAWESFSQYAIKLDRDSAWFYFGTFAHDAFPFDRFRPVAIALFTESPFSYTIQPPPYGITFGHRMAPLTRAPLLIELDDDNKVGLDVSSHFGWFPCFPSVRDGDPKPPRTMELYQANSWSTFRGASISSGSLTSHPIPVYGYREWELLMDADQDFTISVQYLAPSGNWRTFDNYSSPAGSKRIHLLVDEPMILARVVITPSTYPMTINDAFAILMPGGD
jgi:hypothetical protein